MSDDDRVALVRLDTEMNAACMDSLERAWDRLRFANIALGDKITFDSTVIDEYIAARRAYATAVDALRLALGDVAL